MAAEIEGDREAAADVVEPVDQTLAHLPQQEVVVVEAGGGAVAMRADAAPIEDDASARSSAGRLGAIAWRDDRKRLLYGIRVIDRIKEAECLRLPRSQGPAVAAASHASAAGAARCSCCRRAASPAAVRSTATAPCARRAGRRCVHRPSRCAPPAACRSSSTSARARVRRVRCASRRLSHGRVPRSPTTTAAAGSSSASSTATAPTSVRTFARGWCVPAVDLLADADLLVPVPLHWTRLFARHYNQAALAGAGGRPTGRQAGGVRICWCAGGGRSSSGISARGSARRMVRGRLRRPPARGRSHPRAGASC